MTNEERANAILASNQVINHPYDGDPTKRIVGWVVDADLAGVSESIFALEEIQKRARCRACGSTPPVTSTTNR